MARMSSETRFYKPNRSARHWRRAVLPAFLSGLALAASGCGSAQRNFPGLAHARSGNGDQTFQLKVGPAAVGPGDHTLTIGANIDCSGTTDQESIAVTAGNNALAFNTYTCDTPHYDSVVIRRDDPLYDARSITVTVVPTGHELHWAVNATESSN